MSPKTRSVIARFVAIQDEYLIVHAQASMVTPEAWRKAYEELRTLVVELDGEEKARYFSQRVIATNMRGEARFTHRGRIISVHVFGSNGVVNADFKITANGKSIELGEDVLPEALVRVEVMLKSPGSCCSPILVVEES